MNVTTLTITADEAAKKLAAYRQLTDRQRTLVDEQMLRLYRMVRQGARVLNVDQAFRQTGIDERGQPRLAMARADWNTCHFHPRRTVEHWHLRGAGLFSHNPRVVPQLKTNLFQLPRDTFDDTHLSAKGLRSPVPHIPPAIRPPIALKNYWILFEATWEEYPIDPFLLRHIHGSLYVIEAEWELTPLEAELLTAIAI